MSNIAAIKPCDIADGPGIRVGVFLSGCPHHCEGCFNSEAWNPDCGKPLNEETLKHIADTLQKPYIRGVSILGGEPLVDYNRDATLHLAMLAKSLHKDVWIYTGYTWEELNPVYRIWSFTDVLVDGRFIQSLADKRLAYRGSSNQRIIDVQATLKRNALTFVSNDI